MVPASGGDLCAPQHGPEAEKEMNKCKRSIHTSKETRHWGGARLTLL
jgi:hypothetical protein